MRTKFTAALAAAVVLLGALSYADPPEKPNVVVKPAAKPAPEKPADDPSKYVVAVEPGEAVSVGPANAPVTLISYLDYQCPYCARYGETQRKIREEYGDKVRIVVKMFPLPFHQSAQITAEAALAAAAQDKFWPMHLAMLKNFKDLAVARQTPPEQLEGELAKVKKTLEEYAKAEGLDVGKFSAALASGAHKAPVQTDLNEARTIGVMATPTTLVNGRYVRGAQPYETFKKYIDEELAWAEKRNRPQFKTAKTIREIEALRKPQQSRQGPDPNKQYTVDAGNAPYIGPKDAKVTVVTFLDYQ